MSIFPRCTCEFPGFKEDPYCQRHGKPFARFAKFITRSEVVLAIEQFVALWPQAQAELNPTKKAAQAITAAHAPLFALLYKAQGIPIAEASKSDQQEKTGAALAQASLTKGEAL